jgi:single-strand DNA-binding protein
MADKNYVDIQGNLTKDCDMKYSGGGMAICRLSVACNESKKNGDTWENIPSYFDVTCFGKLAERVAPMALKGKRFDISGHLKQDRWQSSDGKTQSKVVIIVDDISPCSILGSSSGATGGKPSAGNGSSYASGYSAGRPQTDENGDYVQPDFPDDCPF